MNTTSQIDIWNMAYSAISYMDNLFSIWITITFAAILAVYFTSEKISRFLRFLIIFLYFPTAVMLFIRWQIGAANIGAIQNMADQLKLLTPGSASHLSSVGGIMNVVIFVVGTIATTYFLFTFGNNRKGN